MALLRNIATFTILYIFISLSEINAQKNKLCNIPSLDVRTENSDIIVKGRVLRLLEPRAQDDTLPVDVVITEVYKGESPFWDILPIRLPPPYDEVTNVYRLGGFHRSAQYCLKHPEAREEYILFLTTGSRPTPETGDQELLDLTGGGFSDSEGKSRRSNLELRPEYKSAVTEPLEIYSTKKENDVLSQLGWGKWSSWTVCSALCSSGTQTRQRSCPEDFPDACEGDHSEERGCNMFKCNQMNNMIERMNLQDADGVRPIRNTAYRITSSASITMSNRLVYTNAFPAEFSVLLVLRMRPTVPLENSNLYPMVIVDSEYRLQLAIHVGKNLTVLYGTPRGIRRVTFRDYTLTRNWHYLAFGIRRDSITMVVDCSEKMVHDLPTGDEISIDIDGFISIGEPVVGVQGIDDITFSGDVEQFALVNDAAAAELQCTMPERALPIPPTELFDHYQVDSGNVDVPFNFNPNLVNPGRIFSTESPPTAPVPHSSTTDGYYVSTYSMEAQTDAPTEERLRTTIKLTTTPPPAVLTTATRTTMSKESNQIPDVGILPTPLVVDIDGNAIPGGSNIIPAPAEIRKPTTTEPKPEMAVKWSTTSPKVVAPKITKTKQDKPTMNGLPAEVPDNMGDMSSKEDVSPPGDDYLGDDGDLFKDDDVGSGDSNTGTYNDVGVSWATWSTCTTTCGLGTRYRFGFCQKDSTYLDCKRGHTITSQRRNCQLHDCPGEMQWSDWGTCSRTCGEGSVQTRMAFCPDELAHIECLRPGQTVVERRQCDVPACEDICTRACENGGQCRNGACVCPPGYMGDYCQHQTCFPQCRSGGVCLGNNLCQCPDDTILPYCTRRCVPECHNGAQCIAGNQCQCLDGYHGSRCESPICTTSCRNGGRCIAPDTCQCPPGYGGTDCSQAQCLLGCENGGECIRPDFCRCPPAYRGSRCQIEYCRERCRNGGTCVGPDRCKCPRGFTGAFCQKRSKCPRGCRASETCVGFNVCVPLSFTGGRRKGGGSSGRKNCFPLKSFSQRIQTSYIKPVIRSIQVRCGTFGLQSCNSQRLEYTVAYRTAYRTSYRCGGLG